MSERYTDKEILNFLKSQYLMHIATATTEGKPSASVMLYAIDDDYTIYFATHKDSFKAQNLLANPQISIAIWEHDKMLVQSDAKVELVEDVDKQTEIVNKLADAATKDTDFWPPVFRIKGGDYALFKGIPYWMRALDLEQHTIRQDDPPFSEVDFN